MNNTLDFSGNPVCETQTLVSRKITYLQFPTNLHVCNLSCRILILCSSLKTGCKGLSGCNNGGMGACIHKTYINP